MLLRSLLLLLPLMALADNGGLSDVTERLETTGLVEAAALDPHQDYHSYAEPQKVRVQHVALDLNVDFALHQLRGFAELTLQRIDPKAELILDTRDLTIDSVQAGQGGKWQTASHMLAKADPILGSALHIRLPEQADSVRIHYRTSPHASALQWLTPTQTAGKKLPFLFTQSQAIHARSWIPLQDTPQVRQTYEARIHTPRNLRALMSANNDGNAPVNGEYLFRMPQAISSYLIALAVGDLRFKAMGKRTGVYAEPLTLAKAAKEFEDTETMVQATEKLYGVYSWERYDLLILPPSFPFGGMENPRLTFVTPSVIAGDKSLVSLIAHELAHSWSGNTVTNATWRDLWLNEGFTSYVENRIMEAVYGRDAAVMEQILALKSLNDDLRDAEPRDRVLAVDVRGRDPDETFSDIAYVKGQMFLTYLENAYGREAFDGFLHDYFEHFRMQTLSSEDFLQYMDEHLMQAHPGVVSAEKIHEWVYAEGMPLDAPQPQSLRLQKIEAGAKAMLTDPARIAALDASHWSTQEWLHFLDQLPQDTAPSLLQALDARFHLTASGNSEIAHRWLLQSIRSHYKTAEPALTKYLTQYGRRKLIVPLYQELIKTAEGKAYARKVYASARAGYHPIAQATLDKLLNFKAK